MILVFSKILIKHIKNTMYKNEFEINIPIKEFQRLNYLTYLIENRIYEIRKLRVDYSNIGNI